ncbi:hypothetical protein SANTM175S_08870 [Streptomyces antimycoticus]
MSLALRSMGSTRAGFCGSYSTGSVVIFMSPEPMPFMDSAKPFSLLTEASSESVVSALVEVSARS